MSGMEGAHGTEHTLDGGEWGDPNALGAGECGWMQRRQQFVLPGRSVMKQGKALDLVLPTGKVPQRCMERGNSLRNLEVV